MTGSPSRARRFSLVLLGMAAQIGAVDAPDSFGATVSVSHARPGPGQPAVDRLVYVADPGEVNDVTVSQVRDGTNLIEDRGATIVAGEGCVSSDPHRVACTTTTVVLGAFSLRDENDRIAVSIAPGATAKAPRVYDSVFPGVGDDRVKLTAPGGPSSKAPNAFVGAGQFRGAYSVQADIGDDVVEGSADADVIDGGRGRDRISGGDGNDLLSGAREDDVLSGGRGDDFLLGSDLDAFNFRLTEPGDHDVLDGGPGADLVAGGPGSDLLHGGGGLDTLLYARELSAVSTRPAKLRVTFDGRANDGPRGERDNVERRDVESAISVGAGIFSVDSTIALDGGAYALAGGSSARATITTLSGAGTRGSQFATFYGSDFTVRPQRLGGPPTEIRLAGAALSCATRALSPGPLGTIARKRRGLWGKGKGRFRTHGKHAAATVRGTTWFTEDRCDGTLVRVVEGQVAVRDFGRRRTVLVPAGQSYLARSG